jgi:ribose/xylose/arabinose/galactoside ABC-type transport system permease subunit
VLAKKEWVQQSWVRPLITLAVILSVAMILAPEFRIPGYLLIVLRQVSETGILATGMTLVIISGGIDLSVGSLLALSATLFAAILTSEKLPFAVALPTALAAAVGASTLFGLANGIVSTGLRIQPFIVTLATMIGARGFARWVVDNNTIDIGFQGDRVSDLVRAVAQPQIIVPSFLVVAVIGLILLNYTRWGRYLFAVGGSENAARLSGIAVSWVKIRVYLLSGALAGLAGILHTCQNRQGNPNDGVSYELDAIAAAVIGGTSLAGGKGSIFGAFVGTLVLGIIINLLRIKGFDENVQWMLKAAIIVAAVWIQLVGTKRRD